MIKLIIKDDFICNRVITNKIFNHFHFEHGEEYIINRIARVDINGGYELDIVKNGEFFTVELWLIEDWKDLFEIVIE